ncbi:Rhodanese-like domain-containing protein [Mycena rebaudengoi]|nr:Rhodanese-like domain-containing protein [Mycena rebaudengoi]
MLRIIATRSVARGLGAQLSRSTFSPRTLRRYESTESKPDPQQAFKAARKLSDELQSDWAAKVLTYEELLPKTKSPSPDSYLIDVREPDEVIQGMIPSAVNLPLSVLSNSLHLQPDAFKAKHGFEKPKKTQEVIFYCRSGKRSTSASDVAKRNGFTNILNYTGSWLEWVEKGGEKAV